MLKYPIFLQDNENSCGAYCIKMLLSFYKRDDEIKNIKKRCRLTKEGLWIDTSFKEISSRSKSLSM